MSSIMADDDIRLEGIDGITSETLNVLINDADKNVIQYVAGADWSNVIGNNNEDVGPAPNPFFKQQDTNQTELTEGIIDNNDEEEEIRIREEILIQRMKTTDGNNQDDNGRVPNESLLNRRAQWNKFIGSSESEINDEHVILLPNFDSRRKKMRNQKKTNKIVRVDKRISDDDKEKARKARAAGYTKKCYNKKRTRWEEARNASKANTGMEFNVQQSREEIFEEGNRLITTLNNIHNLDPATEFRQKWKGITDRKEFNVTFQKLKKDAKEARDQFKAAEMGYANKEKTPHLNPKTLAATKSKKKRRMETFEAELKNLEVEIEIRPMMELVSEFRNRYNLPNPVGSNEPGDPG